MNDRSYERTYYSRAYSPNNQQMVEDQERMAIALLVLMLGLGIGTVIAILFAQRRPKKTRLEQLTDQASEFFEDGRETTARALEGLQKDFERFRKDVEKRLKTLQS